MKGETQMSPKVSYRALPQLSEQTFWLGSEKMNI